MKQGMKYLWIGLAVLLLLYAFDVLIFGLINPVSNPIGAFANKAGAALISIALAAGILAYLNYAQYEKD